MHLITLLKNSRVYVIYQNSRVYVTRKNGYKIIFVVQIVINMKKTNILIMIITLLLNSGCYKGCNSNETKTIQRLKTISIKEKNFNVVYHFQDGTNIGFDITNTNGENIPYENSVARVIEIRDNGKRICKDCPDSISTTGNDYSKCKEIACPQPIGIGDLKVEQPSTDENTKDYLIIQSTFQNR